MITYQIRQSSMKSQQGSVMLVAMVFLVLTSIIALTTMNTSILEIKMAGNQQFQEEAIQIAEGISDEIVFNHNHLTDPTLPLNNAKEGEKFCETTAVAADCMYKTMYITPAYKATFQPLLDLGATYKMEALRKHSSSAGRADEGSAGSTLHAYFEVFTWFYGSNIGLADSILAVGVDKKTLDLSTTAGGSAVSVKAGNDGTGGGVYRFL